MKDNTLNEAKLEVLIGAVLKQTFPTWEELKIKHQESFTIKFGHHNVTVDLKTPNEKGSRAIYDILITTEDEKTNLILLELKREGLAISDEDRKQGISYARLIDQMPPITLISNGTENYFYNTYTNKQIEIESMDFEFIQNLIDKSFSLAIQDFKNAVNILLGNNPQLVCSIINKLSEQNFNHMKGNLANITKPICDDFLIKRDYTNKLHEIKNKKLTALVGHAYSGKTNILYDYFKTYEVNNEAIFYLDCKEQNYSIFKKLANGFTSVLEYHITENKIREWIILSLNRQSGLRFTLLLDNFDNQVSSEINSDILELIDIIDSERHSIIYTIDLVSYQILSKNKFRNYDTFFGSNTQVITINELSQSEFDSCHVILFNVCQAKFEEGAYFSIEYRHPHILRLIAAHYQDDEYNLPKNQVIKIPSIADFDIMRLIVQNKSFNTDLIKLHEKLAIAFLRDRNKNLNSWTQLASYHGGITFESINKVFDNNLNELINSGFVNRYELGTGNYIFYPKLSELVGFSGIKYIAQIILKKSNSLEISELYNLFEKLCMPFISGDNVAVGVLFEIGKYNADLFSNMLQYMLTLKPEQSTISNGTRAAMLLNERTRVELNFKGDNFEETFLGNYFPHLVLAQLAGYPMKSTGTNSVEMSEYQFHLELIHTLGQSPISYVKIGNFSFGNTPPIISHDFPTVGSIICEQAGVIEPLVQSIKKCLYIIPDEIISLSRYAFEYKQNFLLWKIFLATRTELLSTNTRVAQIAKEFIEKFQSVFSELISDLIEKSE